MYTVHCTRCMLTKLASRSFLRCASKGRFQRYLVGDERIYCSLYLHTHTQTDTPTWSTPACIFMHVCRAGHCFSVFYIMKKWIYQVGVESIKFMWLGDVVSIGLGQNNICVSVSYFSHFQNQVFLSLLHAIACGNVKWCPEIYINYFSVRQYSKQTYIKSFLSRSNLWP